MSLYVQSDKMESILERLRKDGYNPEQEEEETLDFVRLSGGGEVGRISQGRRGLRVLSTDFVMFVDVDADTKSEENALFRLAEYCAYNPHDGFLVYRTRAGLRYLCTTRLFDPESDETKTIMRSLDADPKYILLCEAQKSFRARLTPKPNRCMGYGADKFATCALMFHAGRIAFTPATLLISVIHDSATGAMSRCSALA